MNLEERVAKVERENRMLRIALLLVAGGVALYACWQPERPAIAQDKTSTQNLRVRSIEIVDAKGEVVGGLTDRAWYIVDQANKAGIELSVKSDGPHVQLLTKGWSSEYAANSISISRNQEELGKPKPIFEVGPLEDLHGGILNIYSPLGKVVASLQSNKANTGALYLTDAAGNRRAP